MTDATLKTAAMRLRVVGLTAGVLGVALVFLLLSR